MLLRTISIKSCVSVGLLLAAGLSVVPWPVAAQDLPPGVPRSVSADGKTIHVPEMFSSVAYEQEALQLLLREASLVAEELKLPEELPIREENLTHKFVGPFGYAYAHKKIGNITTSKYFYGVAQGNKFNNLVVADYDKTCLDLRDKGILPVSELDTATPYQLATQWLAALSMDVNRLNQHCKVRVALSPFWNGLTRLGEKPKTSTFVPIYSVWWTPKDKREDGAEVELYLPEKKLLQLFVDDPRYILRKPLTFSNLASVFPGTAMIVTNRPSKANSRPLTFGP